jgi:hypothetical protein
MLAPNNNRGVTYQTDEKHLNNMPEYFFGVDNSILIVISRVRPCRVRPVRWQIKGCQTTEPRTFDSGFSDKVNLSTLSFMVQLPSVYPISYLGYPLYVRPSLTS